MAEATRIVHRLLLDASADLPYDLPYDLAASQSSGSGRQSTTAWSGTQPISEVLTFIDPAERVKVLKYYHPRDAALSLASVLLKHFALARYLGLPWSSTPITQERHLHNGRPFYSPGGLDFNVSHHGSLAVLAATKDSKTQVGIDIVEVNVEKDSRSIASYGGWRKWVDIFSDAFAPAEVERIQSVVPIASDVRVNQSAPDTRAALSVFYAHWALKEAYIKMTSEAFMAKWLRDLEFRNVRVPKWIGAQDAKGGKWSPGEVVGDIEVWLRGVRIVDVQVELETLGSNYMVATVCNGREGQIDAIQHVSVDNDIKPLVT